MEEKTKPFSSPIHTLLSILHLLKHMSKPYLHMVHLSG